jgi:membrane protein DedA with SNARE-associated domain
VFDSLFNLLADSPQAYAILFAVAVGDAVFPALPSETAVIVAGLLCVVGDLTLGWVIVFAAAGAFVGDSTSYAIGRFFGRPVQRRFFDGRRGRATLEWARSQLARRGGTLILVARFVPGGRTATTFSAGLTRFPLRLFVPYALVAAVGWAVYAAVLGYLGGRTFHDRPWLALVIALGIAAGIAFGSEGARRIRERA